MMTIITRSRSLAYAESGQSGQPVSSPIATDSKCTELRGEKRPSENESADTSKKRPVSKRANKSVSAQCCSEDVLPGAKPFSMSSTRHHCVSQAENNMHEIQLSMVDILPTTKINELNAMCQKILKVKHVVDVYPAYTNDARKCVVFVAFVKKESQSTNELLKSLGYDIEIKYIQPKYTKDNVGKDDFLMKHEFTDKLRHAIRKFGKTLMLEHTNVSFIRGCKYTLVTNNVNEIKYEPRLAVYVRAKGFIPIGEKPIAKYYEGVRVDVREGVCIPLGGHANDILDNVKMGCQIKRFQAGSLGVLFENDNGLCGITCGHVVCSPEEMQICQQDGGTSHYATNNEVYQPAEPNTIGYLTKVICKKGNDDEAGLDIGVILLTNRPPIDGKFPIAKKTQSDLEFESGKAFEPKLLGEPCYKFGCITEYTRSKIVQTSEEPSSVNLIFGNKPFMTIHNQIWVKTNGTSFAAHGDSGSPVFIRACDGELVCIGIVEAGIHEENDPTVTILVTPITRILQELGISKLKSFSTIETMAKDIADLKESAKDIAELKGSVSRIEQLVINNKTNQCVCS